MYNLQFSFFNFALIVLFLSLGLSAKTAQGGSDSANWKTYTHPELKFSVNHPAKLRVVPGEPGEVVPSQELEWHYPDSKAVIYLGLYDVPEDMTFMAWAGDFEGRVERVMLGSTVALSRTHLDARGLFENEIFIKGEQGKFIISFHFVMPDILGARADQVDLEKKHFPEEHRLFRSMVDTFRFEKTANRDPLALPTRKNLLILKQQRANLESRIDGLHEQKRQLERRTTSEDLQPQRLRLEREIEALQLELNQADSLVESMESRLKSAEGLNVRDRVKRAPGIYGPR